MADIDPKWVMSDLPEDEYDALLTVCERLTETLSGQEEATEEDYELACKMLIRLSGKLTDLKLQGVSGRPWSTDFVEFSKRIRTRQRQQRIDEVLTDELQAMDNRKSEFGLATLTPDEKKRIHQKIASIRDAVEASPLTPKKKNAIFQRLADLGKEVDMVGTRTDRFFSLVGDFAFVFRDMHEKAKPAIEDAKEILEIVVKRRAEDEQVQLPAPDEFPSLPSPSKEGKE